MRAALLLFILATQLKPQESLTIVRDWLPLAPGDRWTYEHEIRGGNRQHPDIERWRQQETVVTVGAIPEGMLVVRRVTVQSGQAPPSWNGVSDESNLLIRDNCLYYLELLNGLGFGWDSVRRQLEPGFREGLLRGEALPNVCLPLKPGKTWGDPNKGRDLWTVAGLGRKSPDDPISVTTESWRLEAHLASGDDDYIWFQKSVGITAVRVFHNGTYMDYRVRLVRFEPAVPR